MAKHTHLQPVRKTAVLAQTDPVLASTGGEPDLVLSEARSVAMAEMFRALADPTRARIVHALIHGDMTTSGLAELLSMSQPSVSQHLRLLRMLRIVRPRRNGRLVFYSLDDAHIRLLVTLSLSHLQETQQAPEPDSAWPLPGEGAVASSNQARRPAR